MKNYLLLTLLILGACGGVSEVDDNSTPQKLGETIFSAIALNDPSLLLKHTFKDREDVKVFFTKFWDRGELTEGYLKNVDRINDARPNVIESLDRVRKTFEQKGLTDWSGFKVENVEFSEAKRGTRLAKDVKIQFTNGDFMGVITVESFAEMDRGWVLLHPLKAQAYGQNPFGR